MRKWWIIITILGAVVSQALTPVFWPMATGGMPMPSASQLPFFIVLSLAESVTFGIGLAFLLFGRKLVIKTAAASQKLAWAVYLSIGWLLISWWPHDNLHRVNGENMQGLLYIEYGFHLTLMIAGLVLAYAFFRISFTPQKNK